MSLSDLNPYKVLIDTIGAPRWIVKILQEN